MKGIQGLSILPLQLFCKSKMFTKLKVHLTRASESGSALAGVAQWIECQPVNQRVTGLIPSQGTWSGCGPGPQ